jgi:hypothetical protein
MKSSKSSASLDPKRERLPMASPDRSTFLLVLRDLASDFSAIVASSAIQAVCL